MRYIAARASLTSCLLLLAGASGAADIPASIARCTAVVDPAQRLDCYDAAAGRAGAKPVVVKPAATAAGAAATGAAAATVASAIPEQTATVVPDTFESVIKSAQRRATGEWRVQLEDGTAWVQADPTEEWSPKVGDTVRLKKAMLGSWFLRRAGSNSTVRVRPAT
jgi:hypothetical protein